MGYYIFINGQYIKLSKSPYSHEKHNYKKLYVLKDSKYIDEPIFGIDIDNKICLLSNYKIYTYNFFKYKLLN